MDIQALGSWGEFLGGIAGVIAALGVIGSLWFVGIQIRDQNRETQLAAVHELSKEFRVLSDAMRTDPELISIYLRVVRDGFEGLDEVSAMRMQLQLQSILRFWEDAYYQRIADRLDLRLWRSIETALSTTVSSPGFKQYWASRSSWYTEQFVEYMNSQMTGKPFQTVIDHMHSGK